jgi:large subunit ribosomal protein L10
MYLKVVRNTLLKIAIIDTKFSSVRKDLYGSLTIIFSPIDPSLLSQIVSDFMIQNNKFKVKHFSVFGRPSEVNKIEHFSFFPSLEDSIMLLCNALIETTAVFVRILNEIPVQSVRIFSAVAKIK